MRAYSDVILNLEHFTFDSDFDGPDHIISLSFDEMKWLVSSIRQVRKDDWLNGKKIPNKSGVKNLKNNRKSLVALKNISKLKVVIL